MKAYQTASRKQRSEKARRMAKVRWDRERAMREKVAAMDPARFEGKIVRRIIVIEREFLSREVVIYDFDSERRAKAKLRAVLRPL